MTDRSTRTSVLHSYLSCPNCGHKEIQSAKDSLHCKSCKTDFPFLNGIPWFFRKPQIALEEWRARVRGFALETEHLSEAIDEDLAQPKLKKSTKVRLEKIKAAYAQQKETVLEILKELDISLSPD